MGREALIAAIENYRTGSTEAREIPEDILCTCFGVTETEVRTVIQENNLKTIEQVTNYCKAGGGCTGCQSEIQRVLDSCTGQQTPVAEKPTAVTSPAGAKPLTNIQKIKLVEKTLDEQVRPALQADGGDIELIDVVGNHVIIALRGMCAQCSVADFTLNDVVQARLREFVSPDIVVEEQK
jgi:NifU-like protein